MSEFEMLLSKLMAAVSYTFKNDSTRPGVLFSVLKDGSFYASVVRYGSHYTSGKKVVCKINASTPTLALEGLSISFLENTLEERNPVVDLANQLSRH